MAYGQVAIIAGAVALGALLFVAALVAIVLSPAWVTWVVLGIIFSVCDPSPEVHVHTIHDCRHTYAINRLLGLDGEPRQSMKFVSHQLGHADEQMLIRIYNKTNAAERLRLIELAEAQQRREA